MSILINTKGGSIRAAKCSAFSAQALGQRLRKARKGAGLSQQELAELFGQTNQSISNWEVGRVVPNCEDIFSYGALLGTDMNWLLLGAGRAKGDHLQAVLRVIEGG